MKKQSYSRLVILTILMIAFLTSCTDKVGADKTLRHFGFKPVEVGGFAFFSGSKGDFYNTKFKAVAFNGDTVEGVVTKGLIFKGSTIRIKD